MGLVRKPMKTAGLYKMASVARISGFSPALLRAWEKRHQLLRPERGPGGHRLYSDEDLRLLRAVKSLLAEGRSIGEIALVDRKELLAVGISSLPQRFSLPSGKSNPKVRRTPAGIGPADTPELNVYRSTIVEAAVELDEQKIEQALDQAFSCVSPEVAIRDVVEPSARLIGDLWSEGRCSVAGEHLASRVFMLRVQKLMEMSKVQLPISPLAICACFPDEQHQLGVSILSYYLSRHGLRVSCLGAALPFEELDRACDVVAPSAVYLSVSRPVLFLTHRPNLLELLKRRARRIHFFIGGCGIEAEDPDLARAGARLWLGGRSASVLDQEFLP